MLSANALSEVMNPPGVNDGRPDEKPIAVQLKAAAIARRFPRSPYVNTEHRHHAIIGHQYHRRLQLAEWSPTAERQLFEAAL